MEPPQICYTLVCVMVGCCSVIAGGLAEGCNINWSRMKVDPASKKRVFGTEFVESLQRVGPVLLHVAPQRHPLCPRLQPVNS